MMLQPRNPTGPVAFAWVCVLISDPVLGHGPPGWEGLELLKRKLTVTLKPQCSVDPLIHPDLLCIQTCSHSLTLSLLLPFSFNPRHLSLFQFLRNRHILVAYQMCRHCSSHRWGGTRRTCLINNTRFFVAERVWKGGRDLVLSVPHNVFLSGSEHYLDSGLVKLHWA